MFGTYFYNKNIRNVVILFGTVFNDIIVRRVNSSNVTQEEFTRRTPISLNTIPNRITIFRIFLL